MNKNGSTHFKSLLFLLSITLPASCEKFDIIWILLVAHSVLHLFISERQSSVSHKFFITSVFKVMRRTEHRSYELMEYKPLYSVLNISWFCRWSDFFFFTRLASFSVFRKMIIAITYFRWFSVGKKKTKKTNTIWEKCCPFERIAIICDWLKFGSLSVSYLIFL